MKYGLRVLALATLSTAFYLSAEAAAAEISGHIAPPPASSSADSTGNPAEYLDTAKAAYGKGNYNDALDAITNAERTLHAKHAELYRPLFPAAPPGWQASDLPNNPINIPASGNVVSMYVVGHKYTQNSNSVVISFGIDTVPVLLSSLMTAPEHPAPGTTISRIDVKGHKALYRENTKGGTVTRSLTLAAIPIAVLISSNTTDKDTLLKFAGSIDYEALQKVK